jgi:MOSC domain-containing protein YiiM
VEGEGRDSVPGAAEPAGRLEAIWRKRAHRGSMDPVEGAALLAGLGLDGSANRGGRRQVTVLSAEAWERATAEVGIALNPAARRANLFVRGLDLRESRGRTLVVGMCRILVGGETTPCYRMDEAAQGLQEALRPEWRGGVFGQVVEGGSVRVGDPVRWLV